MANDDDAPIGTIIPIEEIVAEAPLVVRRHVKWGEVDYARVAYTGKFLDWVLESAEVWFKRTAGESWAQFNGKRGISLPAMGCSLDFHYVLRPDDRLDMTVLLERLGRSSHTLRIVARNQDGVHCFDGEVTFAAVDFTTAKSVPMPEEIKQRFAAYKAACEGAG
jgi:acyl-CoA thioesterase FadM